MKTFWQKEKLLIKSLLQQNVLASYKGLRSDHLCIANLYLIATPFFTSQLLNFLLNDPQPQQLKTTAVKKTILFPSKGWSWHSGLNVQCSTYYLLYLTSVLHITFYTLQVFYILPFIPYKCIKQLIDRRLTPFSTNFQSYHCCQFTYPYVSLFSHTSTPHNNLSKQLDAFFST